MRKIVFQVIQYKPFQILVETFPWLGEARLFSISGKERKVGFIEKQGWDTIVQIPGSE